MKTHGLLLYQNENYRSSGRVLDREENYMQTLAHVSVEVVRSHRARMRAIARSRTPHMPIETFPLHFEGCEHVLNIPLVHNSDHSRCYLCHPELRDRPVT